MSVHYKNFRTGKVFKNEKGVERIYFSHATKNGEPTLYNDGTPRIVCVADNKILCWASYKIALDFHKKTYTFIKGEGISILTHKHDFMVADVFDGDEYRYTELMYGLPYGKHTMLDEGIQEMWMSRYVINGQLKVISVILAAPRRYCVIDNTTGKIICNFGEYWWIDDSSEGYLRVIKNVPQRDLGIGILVEKEWGVMDINGKIIIPIGEYSYIDKFFHGLARVSVGPYDNRSWGIIDTKGKIIVPIEYDEIWKYNPAYSTIVCNMGGHKELFDIKSRDFISQKRNNQRRSYNDYEEYDPYDDGLSESERSTFYDAFEGDAELYSDWLNS